MKKKARDSIPSRAELARRIGLSITAVSNWCVKPEWPFGSPPWPADQLKPIADWIRRRTSDRFGTAKIRRARLRLLVEQDKLLKLTNGIAAGRYCDLQKACAAVSELVTHVKWSLLNLSRSAWMGRTEAEIQNEITEAIEQIRGITEGEFDSVVKRSRADAEPIAPGLLDTTRQAPSVAQARRARPPGASAAKHRARAA